MGAGEHLTVALSSDSRFLCVVRGCPRFDVSGIGRGQVPQAAVRNTQWDVSIHHLLPVRFRRGG